MQTMSPQLLRRILFVVLFPGYSGLVLELDYDGRDVPLYFDHQYSNYESLAKAWLDDHPLAAGGGCEVGDSECILSLLVDAMRAVCQESGASCIEIERKDGLPWWLLLVSTQTLVALCIGYEYLFATRRRQKTTIRHSRSVTKTPPRPRAKSAETPVSKPKLRERSASTDQEPKSEVHPGSTPHRAAWRTMWQASLGPTDNDADLFNTWYNDMFPGVSTASAAATHEPATPVTTETKRQHSADSEYELIARFSLNSNRSGDEISDHRSRLQ